MSVQCLKVTLCTLEMTVLVLGIPPDAVVAMPAMEQQPTRTIPTERAPDFEWTFDTIPAQALLYRLASGDSNKIHVVGDQSMSKALGLKTGDTPILHGLNTFGIASRAISHHVGIKSNVFMQRLEGRFSKPVLLNDSLLVKLWETSDNCTAKQRTIAFVVMNQTRGGVVMDQGFAQLWFDRSDSAVRIASKL